jgi:hypothetical protein
MKKTNFGAFSILVLGIAVLATACNVVEDSAATVVSLTETSTDLAQAESTNAEIESSADYYISEAQKGGYKVQSTVAEESVITTNSSPGLIFPKTITINFGTTGVTGKLGNILKGKILVKLTAAPLISSNYERTMTFDGFTVNGNTIKGYKKVVYNNVSNSWTVTARDTIITSSGTVVSNSDRVRKLVTGTLDKFEISGSSSGVNKKGATYSMTIAASKPLILYIDYPFFVSGVVTTATDKKTVDLDYGNGDRDEKATLTYNGIRKEINLKK